MVGSFRCFVRVERSWLSCARNSSTGSAAADPPPPLPPASTGGCRAAGGRLAAGRLGCRLAPLASSTPRRWGIGRRAQHLRQDGRAIQLSLPHAPQIHSAFSWDQEAGAPSG
eukprot:9577408-Prorocentrum_lima.AAC.1